MKKKFLLLSIVTLSFFHVFAQPPRPSTTRGPQEPIAASEGDLQPLGNPYLDSQYLLQKIDANDVREIVRIIVSYGKIPTDSISFASVNEVITTNIFLKGLLITKIPAIKKYLE